MEYVHSRTRQSKKYKMHLDLESLRRNCFNLDESRNRINVNKGRRKFIKYHCCNRPTKKFVRKQKAAEISQPLQEKRKHCGI